MLLPGTAWRRQRLAKLCREFHESFRKHRAPLRVPWPVVLPHRIKRMTHPTHVLILRAAAAIAGIRIMHHLGVNPDRVDLALDRYGSGAGDIVAAAGPGGGPQVTTFDGRTNQSLDSFFAYASSFAGGVFLGAR